VADTNDWNAKIIKEFRENAGRVGGQFEGAPVLLLHTVGARSGKTRVNPMMYLPDGDRYCVFASYAGNPKNPAWYHNLVAHPEVTVEVGTEKFPARASVLQGAERDAIYAKQATLYPGFREYQEKTTRTIPVIAIERS
jgi:deazaflavin-dependent oxidoreductase (nitroreductase family)